MNKLIVVLAASVLAVGAACGAPPAKPKASVEKAVAKPVAKAAAPIGPAQAIAAVAKAAREKDGDGLKGVFEFRVASVGAGSRGRGVFLNSEADYHDAKNLSVQLRPEAVKALEASLGAPLDKTMAGKRISVTGTARAKSFNVYDADGSKTGKTWSQTRIIVAKADNLVVK
jgi:hypothetical protein